MAHKFASPDMTTRTSNPNDPSQARAYTEKLTALDHAHLWHPFTPMKQWRDEQPLIIESGVGPYLIDTLGNKYIDGVSSLWCNVHGHQVPEIDNAIRNQLAKIGHSTLLGLSNVPAIELAAKLAQIAPHFEGKSPGGKKSIGKKLNKVFYSDAGATAVEVAFKMAVGYWHHKGQPQKTGFIGFAGAYHGDTTGAMSVGYSELFHKPFVSMVFPTKFAPVPDALRADESLWKLYEPGTGTSHLWPSESTPLNNAMKDQALAALEDMLSQHADKTAAIVIEPIIQGAAGMITQPPGFLKAVSNLAKKYNVLLIADEVAVGFCRTGKLFACEHEEVTPDILCVAKGITGGYLPLAATLTTDEIEAAFTGELSERKTLYHGHTYTGNPLASAAALATIGLIESKNVIGHVQAAEALIRQRLDVLRDEKNFPHVLDVRQRGVMVGIELGSNRADRKVFDFSRRTGAMVCRAMRPKGLIIRPLGDILVLMPIPGMPLDVLGEMLDTVIETLAEKKSQVMNG